MSTCPEKDLHSVYVDGELPAQFLAEYESHLASCEKCRAQVEKLRSLRSIFSRDSASHATDSTFSEESFSRLQTKLKYSRTANTIRTSSILSFPPVKWALSAGAAAAVFALIATPQLLRSSASAQNETVQAIAYTELEPISEKSPVIDGNFSYKELASLKVSDEAQPESKKEEVQGAATVEKLQVEQKTIGAYTVSTRMGKRLSSVDVFRPNFTNRGISIKVPTIDQMPPADHSVTASENTAGTDN